MRRAKRSPRKAAAKRACDAQVVRRLAQRFPPAPWGELHYDANGIGGLLGIDDEEASLMLDLGVFGEAQQRDQWAPKSVGAAEVLRFLETHGAEWFRVRLEKQMADLQRQVRRRAWLKTQGTTVPEVEQAELAEARRIHEAMRVAP